ncbi:hypothetical protein LIER_41841 [Lithospermum erythrorhizon]|uniref:GAG-pre-integrase domain-containing protein n=1 Tax=Lithospermum erythrorhizon TaxID=34254 RepID=A0AAV3RIS1_LITER
MSVADYFGKLEKLWDDLTACNPIPACVCGLGEQFQQRIDEEKFHDFLYGLDATRFGHLRSQLLPQDLTLSLDWVFQAMNQEEQLHKRNSIVKSAPEDVMTFAVNTHHKTNSDFKSRFLLNVTCTFCHRVGHEEATCFGRNGFPEWWGDWPQVRGRGGPGRAPNQGRGGAPPPRQRVAEARNFLSDVWIIDSGASNHVTGNLFLLKNVRDMPPCTISLPDGSTVTSLKCGSDQRSGMLIGLCERRGGLYYFRGRAVQVNRVVEKQDPVVWHRRLGHPSAKVVSTLPFNFSLNNVLVEPCDIYFQAKETRDLFPSSDNKACRSFDLVHFDVWGPYKTRSTCGASFFLTIVDDFSRGVWIFFMNDKTEVFILFTRFGLSGATI